MKTVTIDPKKCVGCRNCEMACAHAQTREICVREYSNMKVNTCNDDHFVLPMTCFHCEDAWCLNVCPANAISRDSKTQAVKIDKDRCAGCKMCILSCPYGNIHFDHEEMVSKKCDLCDGDPQCVKHCIAGALNFEEIEVYTERKREGLDKKLSTLIKEL